MPEWYWKRTMINIDQIIMISFNNVWRTSLSLYLLWRVKMSSIYTFSHLLRLLVCHIIIIIKLLWSSPWSSPLLSMITSLSIVYIIVGRKQSAIEYEKRMDVREVSIINEYTQSLFRRIEFHYACSWGHFRDWDLLEDESPYYRYNSRILWRLWREFLTKLKFPLLK